MSRWLNRVPGERETHHRGVRALGADPGRVEMLMLFVDFLSKVGR